MDIRYLCLTSLRNKKEGRKSEIGEYQELKSEIKLKQNHREIKNFSKDFGFTLNQMKKI